MSSNTSRNEADKCRHRISSEEQITNCRELLKIFKDERETYGDSNSVNLDQVVGMIKRKQEILTSFSKQKEIMQSIKEHGHQNEDAEKSF